MKSIALFLAACLLTLTVFAQNSMLTINVKGNATREVFIDGNRYTVQVDVNNVNTQNTPIVLNNLTAGQHTIRIVFDENRQNDYVSYFTLRNGFDMSIIVNNNGTIRTIESVSGQNGNNNGYNNNIYHAPMSTARFNTLLQQVRYQQRGADRQTSIKNAFTVSGNYFSSSQAKQLIQYVNSQSSRLELAKSAYPLITDPNNFSQVTDLLNSPAKQNELEEYIAYYNSTNQNGQGNTYRTPMSATAFNKLYNSASQQYSSVQKRTYISNAFASLNNYFTTAQAMKLIVLVNDDASRLFLAKSSFRGITDPENFSNVNSLLYTQSSRNELAVYVSNYNNSNSQTGRVAWTASYFNTIYYTAQQKLPSSTRVSYLAEIFSNSSSYYSVDQAKQLIRLVNGESDRLQLAKSAYRGLSNFSDYTQMNDLFSYQSSRNEFAAYVNSYQSGNPIVYRHLAMADEDFRTLYRNVQNEWLPFAKMQALQGIFNNNDYFFTSTQARQLIQLVSAEANRLALAKLAYGNVVDPENFNQLSDLLSLQASRDELATYVKTYAGIGQ